MKTISIILGVVVVVGAIVLFGQSDNPTEIVTTEAEPVKQVVLSVEGMTCAGCAVSVKMALKGLDGVTETQVDVDKGETTITFSKGKVTTEQLIKAINSTGFTARKPSAG